MLQPKAHLFPSETVVFLRSCLVYIAMRLLLHMVSEDAFFSLSFTIPPMQPLQPDGVAGAVPGYDPSLTFLANTTSCVRWSAWLSYMHDNGQQVFVLWFMNISSTLSSHTHTHTGSTSALDHRRLGFLLPVSSTCWFLVALMLIVPASSSATADQLNWPLLGHACG